MNSVRCPTPPHLPKHHTLGTMLHGPNVYEFHWLQPKREVLIFHRNMECNSRRWVLQADGLIRDSITDVLGVPSDRWIMVNWKLTNMPAFEHDEAHFLDCNWSDYAVDTMAVEFEVAAVDR